MILKEMKLIKIHIGRLVQLLLNFSFYYFYFIVTCSGNHNAYGIFALIINDICSQIGIDIKIYHLLKQRLL